MNPNTMIMTSAAAARPCSLARPWMTSDDAIVVSSGFARPTAKNVAATNVAVPPIVRDHAAVYTQLGGKSAPPPRGVPR